FTILGMDVRRPSFERRRTIARMSVLVVERVAPPRLARLDVEIPHRIVGGARHQLEALETLAQFLLAPPAFRDILGYSNVVLDGLVAAADREAPIPDPSHFPIRPDDAEFLIERAAVLFDL